MSDILIRESSPWSELLNWSEHTVSELWTSESWKKVKLFPPQELTVKEEVPEEIYFKLKYKEKNILKH